MAGTSRVLREDHSTGPEIAVQRLVTRSFGRLGATEVSVNDNHQHHEPAMKKAAEEGITTMSHCRVCLVGRFNAVRQILPARASVSLTCLRAILYFNRTDCVRRIVSGACCEAHLTTRALNLRT